MCNTTTTMLHTLQTFKNDTGSNWKKKQANLLKSILKAIKAWVG